MAHGIFFLVALLIVAANLRAAITGVGALLPAIQADLALTASAAGLLTSLPVLMFGLFAPLARFGERHGPDRLVMAGLVVLVLGIVLRSSGGSTALYAGTVMLGAAIATINVLMPALVKEHYPTRIPAMTSAYATAMQVFASLASGIAVPLAVWLPGGWRMSLASWAVLGVLGILCWLPHMRGVPQAVAPAAADASRVPVWRRALAWQIAGFMGLQSTLFYTAISWYPTYLIDRGFTATSAGWLMFVYQVAALVAGMLVPRLIGRFADQRLLAAACPAIGLTATAGLLLAPQWAMGWVVVLGLGAGPSLVLSLSFIGLRAGSARTAASLSLMVQGVGYFIAMFGPLVFGVLHDVSQGWVVPLLFIMAAAVGQGLCGLGAGRRMVVN